MDYQIIQNLIPGLPRNPYRHGASAFEGVTNHSTDNTVPAVNERNNEVNHWQDAFVHFFVDWVSIIQVADTDYICWGCGPVGNQRYVQIELCQTSDPNLFKESYNRYVWLTAYILKSKNLGVTDGVTLVSHDWITKNLGGTTHTDPIAYLASHGISWGQHVSNVKAEYERQLNPNTYTVVSGDTLWGISRKTGISVDQLKSINGLTTDVIQVGQVLKLKSPPAPTTRKIFLPADNDTWTVYKLAHPCVKSNPDNIAGVLTPSKFGGLTYDILKDNGNYIFEIQTQAYGRVQIYGAPETGAKII
jgi:LysM repeat protein